MVGRTGWNEVIAVQRSDSWLPLASALRRRAGHLRDVVEISRSSARLARALNSDLFGATVFQQRSFRRDIETGFSQPRGSGFHLGSRQSNRRQARPCSD
jgi:hypothetical protein